MGLTAQQLNYLRTADQRFRARVALFDGYTPTITNPSPADTTGTLMAFKPMPLVSPRKSMVNNSAAITLYATDSFNRGGAYVGNANVSWSLTSGGGTLNDNADGTATYTAPGAGSGTAVITMTATNSSGTSDAIAYVQYPNTTYDEIVADIASLSGSTKSGGWRALVRLRGNASGFTIGKGLLVHIEDTWAGTTSTFGGYRYSEGNFFGYITESEYVEGQNGDGFLALVVESPSYHLKRMKVGETWWGTTSNGGKLYYPAFAPMDSIWYFVRNISDFYKYHNVTIFYDTNSIDDFVVDESNLWTIFQDVTARTKCIAYCDRYGSLLCIPDPDIRAAEWWGTPAPLYDSTGAGPMTTNDVTEYSIVTNPYTVKKLRIDALDSSKLGIWAISEQPTAIGEIVQHPGKLVCDAPMTLAGWAAQTRAQMNRAWQIQVSLPLNHTIDLCNFVDVNFTAPTVSNAPTASGQTWVDNISYRPGILRGSWQGTWSLLKRTNGDIDGTSAWGGSGQYAGEPDAYAGPALPGGGWATTEGGVSSWTHLFDFSVSEQGWTTATGVFGAAGGTYAAGVGWRSVVYNPGVDDSKVISIKRHGPTRTVTGYAIWWSGNFSGTGNLYQSYAVGVSTAGTDVDQYPINPNWVVSGSASGTTAATQDISSVSLYLLGFLGDSSPAKAGWSGTAQIISAKFGGIGSDPFGSATPL